MMEMLFCKPSSPGIIANFIGGSDRILTLCIIGRCVVMSGAIIGSDCSCLAYFKYATI
jgi:hypothetical protein